MRALTRASCTAIIVGVCATPFSNAAFTAEQRAAKSTPSVSSRQLTDLYLQMQQLQREMMALRGLVEEQSYRINTLERQRRQDYQNLDRRLQGQSGVPAASASSRVASSSSHSTQSTSRTKTVAASSTAATAAVVSSAPKSTATRSSNSKSERDAYQEAFQLLKQQNLKQAELAYKNFVRDYPNGKYSSNAYYWLGELYLTDENLPKARDTFKVLVQRYPAYRKTPESNFKLAKIYYELGDKKEAEVLLNKIVRQYRTSSPATSQAANSYLQQHFR